MELYKRALMLKHYVYDISDTKGFRNSDLTTYLCVNSFEIKSLNFLSNFEKLRYLEIRRSEIKNFSGLLKINLEEININSDNFKLKYIKPSILSKIHIVNLKIDDNDFLNKNYFKFTKCLSLELSKIKNRVKISRRCKNLKTLDLYNSNNFFEPKVSILSKDIMFLKANNFNLGKIKIGPNCKNLVLNDCGFKEKIDTMRFIEKKVGKCKNLEIVIINNLKIVKS